VKYEGASEFLDEMAGDRPLREVLSSLAENVCKGTENGMFMDNDSALIYRQAHFTWMDPNFPAGTPR
ncbi:MAG: hypothetical protein HRT88_18655, partial [Lentisphaeraceae bacterium]|nr:hypothetical protein [Lentisphaeraceae bacterium]